VCYRAREASFEKFCSRKLGLSPFLLSPARSLTDSSVGKAYYTELELELIRINHAINIFTRSADLLNIEGN
jgi:hypothetical protein